MASLSPPPTSAPIVDVKVTKDRAGEIRVAVSPNRAWQTWFNELFRRTGSFDETPYAPSDGTYIVRTSTDLLSNEQVLGSLDSGFLKVTTGTGEITSTNTNTINTAHLGDLAVTTDKLDNDAVTNAKISNGAVSLEHLDSGIAPAYYVKYAGSFNTLGGDANESISVPGATSFDIAYVIVSTRGGTPRYVESAATGADTIDVVMSGDPGADHVLKYFVLRAAS